MNAQNYPVYARLPTMALEQLKEMAAGGVGGACLVFVGHPLGILL